MIDLVTITEDPANVLIISEFVFTLSQSVLSLLLLISSDSMIVIVSDSYMVRSFIISQLMLNGHMQTHFEQCDW